MRFQETVKKNFHLRVIGERTGKCAVVFGRAQFVRAMWNGETAFALKTMNGQLNTMFGTHTVKGTITILLLSVYLCSCSQKHDSLDRVQTGKDISFGNHVLHVEKRAGSSLEGVRIVSREPDGEAAIITADKGTLSHGADEFSIKVVLHNAHLEKATRKWSVDKLTVILPITGL